MNKSSVAFLIFFMASNLFAGDPYWSSDLDGWKAWSNQCASLDEEYKNNFPKKPIKKVCRQPNTGRSNYAMSKDHLNAMVAQIFWAYQSRDQITASRAYYHFIYHNYCKNDLQAAIRKSYDTIDSEIKAQGWSWKYKAESVKEEVLELHKLLKAWLEDKKSFPKSRYGMIEGCKP